MQTRYTFEFIIESGVCKLRKIDQNTSHFELFFAYLGFIILLFDVLILNRITLAPNKIKLSFSNNIKSSMRMLYHYYYLHELLSSNDALLDLVI